MTTPSLIFRDVDGIPDRVATLREAFPGEVFHVCPHHLAIPGAIPIEIPAEWLPTHIYADNRPRAEWWAADALTLAAVRQLGIDAPFVWTVESDIVGPVEKWREVFARTEDSPADGIFSRLMPRNHPFASSMKHWHHAPPWATHACLAALYRLSARAIAWTTADIESQREYYSEVRIPSGIIRHGGTVRDLREYLAYSAPGSFSGNAATQRFHPGILNHPVKSCASPS